MKNKLYIIILFILAFLIAEQKTTPEKLQKVATQKHNILSKNFNDASFYKHPQYKKLLTQHRLEINKIRRKNFKNDSLYKLEIKHIRSKHDSLVVKLFNELAKK